MSSEALNILPDRPHQELQLQLVGAPLGWSGVLCSRGALRGFPGAIIDKQASTKEAILLRLRAGLCLSSESSKKHDEIIELLWDYEGGAAFQGMRSAVQSVANLQSMDVGRPKRRADESYVADRVADAIWAYGWNLPKQAAWHNLQADIHDLYTELNQPSALLEKNLFGHSLPPGFEGEITKMQVKLTRFGRQWPLWIDWYHAAIFPRLRGSFYHEMVENIADRSSSFWSDDPNEVIDNITRITGWPEGVITPEEHSQAQPNARTPDSTPNANELTQYITDNSRGMLQSLSGLIRLVELEREKVAAELPNSSDRQDEVAVQLEWFDQLLSGLREIRASLIDSTPKDTAKKIERITSMLEEWYGRQADWAQKSIRLTAVGSTALGLISLGMPPWLSVVVPGMFFAKKEIQEVRDAVRNEQ